MRIGHYAPAIWRPGGISTYIRRLGAAQSERGHTVVYLSQDPADADENSQTHVVSGDESLFQQVDALNLDVLHLHKAVSGLPENCVRTVRTMHGHQASCPSASRYLSRPGRPCNRIPGLGACLFGHVVDRCGSARPHQVAANFSRFHHEIDFTSRVPTLTVSDFLRKRMIEAGCPGAHLQTLLSPAPDVKGPLVPMNRSSTPRFLFLGRLAPQKGIFWLVRAFAQLSCPAHLDVAGDGDLMDDVQAFVRSEGLQDRVTIHGWVDDHQISTLITSARAVVFPSVWHEPAGLVSLEAAAHGRALIASRVGGIPEYADPSYALLVAPNDVDGLAAAISRLATDADDAEQLGAQGATLVRTKHTMSAFVDQMDAVYDSLPASVLPPAPSPAPQFSLVAARRM